MSNLLFNAAFSQWSNGTPITATPAGTVDAADGWGFTLAGGTPPVVALSKGTFTQAETRVPPFEGIPNYCRVANATKPAADASATARLWRQVSWDGMDISRNGHTLNLSFYARAKESSAIAARIVRNFGSGSSPVSPDLELGWRLFQVQPTWGRFTFFVPLPDLEDYSVGDGSAGYMEVSLCPQYGERVPWQTEWVDFTGVQLEFGTAPTAFQVSDSIQSNPDLSLLWQTRPLVGYGSPEGAVSASPGAAYLDLNTLTRYSKATGVGATGWV